MKKEKEMASIKVNEKHRHRTEKPWGSETTSGSRPAERREESKRGEYPRLNTGGFG